MSDGVATQAAPHAVGIELPATYQALDVPHARSRKVVDRAAKQGLEHAEDTMRYVSRIAPAMQGLQGIPFHKITGAHSRTIATKGFGTVGVAEAQGVRRDMQDAQHARDYAGGSVLSLFDGHGMNDIVAKKGAVVAPNMLIESLGKLDATQRRDPVSIEKVVKDAFALKYTGLAMSSPTAFAKYTYQLMSNITNVTIQDVLGAVADQAGSTALICFREGNHFIVPNLSDSRLVVVQDGKGLQLTVDQTVEINRDKLEALGADITREFDEPVLRADGLATARAVGDTERRIMRRPQVTQFTLNASAKVAMVCDGILEVLTNEDIAAIVSAMPPEQAAKELVRRAYERGSQDNMTAMVADVAV